MRESEFLDCVTRRDPGQCSFPVSVSTFLTPSASPLEILIQLRACMVYKTSPWNRYGKNLNFLGGLSFETNACLPLDKKVNRVQNILPLAVSMYVN